MLWVSGGFYMYTPLQADRCAHSSQDMELTPLALVVIALVLAAWTGAAAVLVLRANAKASRAKAVQLSLKKMQHLVDVAPAVPLLVRTDGRIEAPERLARWLGLSQIPAYISEPVSYTHLTLPTIYSV